MKIAQRYAKYLSQMERKMLYRLMRYTRIYEGYKLGVRKKNVANLIGTAITLPLESLSDRRFLGMVKAALLKP